MITKTISLSVDFEASVEFCPAKLVEGDIGSCLLEITTEQDITGLVVRIAFSMADGTKYLADCTVVDAHTATLILPTDVLSVTGRVDCQVAVYSDTERLTNAVGFYYFVRSDLADAAVEASDQYPILTQLITDTQTLLDQYDHLEQLASDTAQAKTDAENAETAAEQALADLLAMMGSDIATLTSGKLTPAQIPELSINDVITITDASELIGLTAQRGDVAIVVPVDVVTESYILAADDASVLSNWKKLGVSYVAEAGHSLTADEATNATTINNKRLVAMTQAEYDIAVLDPDTIYVVTP